MRTIIIFSVFLAVILKPAFAQENPPPKPTAKPFSNNTQSRERAAQQDAIERQREAKLELKRQQSYQRLKYLGSDTTRLPRRVRVYRDIIFQNYRKPNKKELRAIRPGEDDFQRYTSFLKRKDTGIFRLVPDAGCAVSTKVLVVSPECMKYSMPGGGSSFSFRTKNYRIPRLADLTFTGKGLIAKGVLLEALFVSLGDVPLQQVSLGTKGVRFLHSKSPSRTAEDAFSLAQDLADGRQKKGFVYSRGVLAKENVTFALRTIAFRGKWLNASAGVTYNELDFDKRRDVIVAFRIVRKDVDGSITILWKRLQNLRSPKLEIEERE